MRVIDVPAVLELRVHVRRSQPEPSDPGELPGVHRWIGNSRAGLEVLQLQAKDVQELLALLNDAGHSDFRG